MPMSTIASIRPREEVPRFLVYGALILLCLLLVPPAIVARVRAAPSAKGRISLIQDMDNQPRYSTQQPNPVFADNRSMRPRLPGVVARQDPLVEGVATQGAADGKWATTLPPGMKFD